MARITWVFLFCDVAGCYSLADGGGGGGGEGEGAPADANGDGVPDDIGPDPDVRVEPSGEHLVCSTPEDLDCDGFPNEADVDADGDLILDAAPPAALVAAVAPLAVRVCSSLEACCEGGWSGGARTSCGLRATGSLVLLVAQEWEARFVEVDPGGLDACLASVEVDCGSQLPWMPDLEGCRAYFAGRRDEWQLCVGSLDCGAGLYCTQEEPGGYGCGEVLCTPSTQPETLGECRPAASLGEACASATAGGPECDEGLSCAWRSTQTCVARGEPDALDQPCEDEDGYDDSCAAGLWCSDAGTCAARVADGEHCLRDRECGDSSTCDAFAERCVPSRDPTDFCAAGVNLETGW